MYSKVPFPSCHPPRRFDDVGYDDTLARQQGETWWTASMFNLHKLCVNKVNIKHQTGENCHSEG